MHAGDPVNQNTTNIMNSKQYQEGWVAYCYATGYDNPYTNPEWADEWEQGYEDARRFNKGL